MFWVSEKHELRSIASAVKCYQDIMGLHEKTILAVKEYFIIKVSQYQWKRFQDIVQL
jgi:hypothetical protein